MQMDEGMDTGPIIAQVSLPLTGQERRGELSQQLARLGAELLLRVLPLWLSGKIVARPQEHSKATYSRLLRKEDGEIDWSKPATFIERSVRAYSPWPGTYTKLRGKYLRIWQASVASGEAKAPPGTILLEQHRFQVATGEGLLALEQIQLEGKRRLEAAAFLRGQHDLNGAHLG
jgi:methionyl-tRNA formyltransferase